MAALELYVNKTTITAIKLLILRSFPKKGLCDSSLKAKSTTFARNITTIRLRSQNDEVVVTTPVESRIMSIRGNQIMIDRDLAELYGVETKRLNEAVKRNIELLILE